MNIGDRSEAFIDDFLKHDYDPVKAREYYLRTRKLVGRKLKGIKKDALYVKDVIDRPGHHALKKFDAWDKKNRAAYDKRMSARPTERQERLEAQQRKINAARARVKKLQPKERSALEKKLDAVQNKLNRAKNHVGGVKRDIKKGWNAAKKGEPMPEARTKSQAYKRMSPTSKAAYKSDMKKAGRDQKARAEVDSKYRLTPLYYGGK